MAEVKQIIGFDYSVSSEGVVTSLITGNIIKGRLNSDGYRQVHLYSSTTVYKTKRVHRLVAQAFISNPENKPTVNHKNGIRDDNRIENLEWATMSEQMQHSYTSLNRKAAYLGKFGKNNPNSKPIKSISITGEEIIFSSGREAAEHFKVLPTMICDILRGKYKNHKAFKLMYV